LWPHHAQPRRSQAHYWNDPLVDLAEERIVLRDFLTRGWHECQYEAWIQESEG